MPTNEFARASGSATREKSAEARLLWRFSLSPCYDEGPVTEGSQQYEKLMGSRSGRSETACLGCRAGLQLYVEWHNERRTEVLPFCRIGIGCTNLTGTRKQPFDKN